MEALGAGLARRAGGSGVVFLSGDLGAGKTTLVRGMLRALGHRGVVTSPTFTLLETYPLAGRTVVHVDLYRVEDPAELEALAIRDYLGEAMLWVEWPDRARGALPAPDCEVHISIQSQARRVVRLEHFTTMGERLCAG